MLQAADMIPVPVTPLRERDRSRRTSPTRSTAQSPARGTGRLPRQEGLSAGQVARTGDGRQDLAMGSTSAVPQALAPKPLFTPEQIHHMERVYQEAPAIFPQHATESAYQSAGERRPTGTVDAQAGGQSLGQPLMMGGLPRDHERLMQDWNREREREEMLGYMRQLHQENLQLRLQLQDEREGRFVTPDGSAPGMDGQGAARVATGPPETEAQSLAERARGYRDELNGEANRASGEKGGPDQEPAHGEHQSASTSDKTMDVMLKIVQSMQAMQEQLMKGQGTAKGGKEDGADETEAIRGGVELHKLPEWSMESAPVDFQDWLLLIGPQMSDLSASSGEWWTEIVDTARSWYQQHQNLKPIERLQHDILPTAKLLQKKWWRLEKRASSLLLQSLPESQREDIISTKSLTVLGILGRLMQNYQPGGAHEKAAVLAALENPIEATSVGEAISGLRRWVRWKRRATDISVALPDPTVLLRGLDKLVNRVLMGVPASQFRVNLSRTTLMIDSVPTMAGVESFAEVLLAELDQLSYSRKKEKIPAAAPAQGQPLKMKRMENDEIPDGGFVKRQDGGKKEKPKCKFFLSEDGCRKGRSCKFSHDQKDDRRRCWICGSCQHMSGTCPTASDNKPKVDPKISKVHGQRAPVEEDDQTSEKAVMGKDNDMKSLLEEAGKMIRSMNNSPSSESATGSMEESDAKIRSLQRQLDELKAMSMKVFRLPRIQPCENFRGLLDSGATHALRPRLPGERIESYKPVHVNLAGDQQVVMRMTPGQVIVGAENVEPIVPLGALISQLGCTLQWTGDHLVVCHPTKGMISTFLCGGCPMVTKEVALELIAELEQVPTMQAVSLECDGDKEMVNWLQRLVREHPVFQGIPEEVRQELMVIPQAGHLTGNKRLRQYWRREKNVILHLYAGPDKDMTFARAAKELGADERQVLEIDILRGDKWDMLSSDLFAELLSMACDGQFIAVLGGPNCRTRSKLRHRERSGLPGPSRQWGGGEWGRPDLSPGELEKCRGDDIMLMRMILLYIVSEEVRRATERQSPTTFLLEHPAEPKGMPDVVSWWRTPQWKAMQKVYSLREIHVDQGAWGGEAYKPTTLGTNVVLGQAPEGIKRARERLGKARHEMTNEELSKA